MLRKPPKATASSANPGIATGQPSANRPAGASVKPTMNVNRYHPCAEVAPMPFVSSVSLHGVGSALAGPDADHLVHRRDEDLAVADLPGAGTGHDRVDRVGNLVVLHQDRQLHLGDEVHDVLRAPVELGVP